MSRTIDISDERFGRLIALEPSKEKATNKSKKWLCKCDCGSKKYIRSSDLRHGKVVSCGCKRSEGIGNRARKHGVSNTLLSDIWQSMKQRCYNKNNKDYPDYGGRGIIICDEWKHDLKEFYDWAIQNGYQKHYTIERINTNGNYEPSNCTWITNEKQALNRRNSRKHIYKGIEYSARELSNKFSINYNTFRAYVNDGKTVEQIIENFK